MLSICIMLAKKYTLYISFLCMCGKIYAFVDYVGLESCRPYHLKSALSRLQCKKHTENPESPKP